jgi:carbon storage regulator CsrA
MLVIRRRAGESLLIGDDIEIEILGLTQGHVKLGIRAPKTVTILRKEVRLAGIRTARRRDWVRWSRFGKSSKDFA